MTSDPSLFAGTAWYYARYRLPYPDQLIRDIAGEFSLDRRGRLLDLGCGPGTVALRFHDLFEEIIGVDPDPDMIVEAARQSEAAGAGNAQWLCMPAESISGELAPVRLVTLGASFHWMDQDRVLRLSHSLLSDNGGIAVFAMPGIWDGPDPWHQEVTRVVKRWLGDERRAGGGTFAHSEERWEQLLERSPFVRIKQREHHFDHVWTVDAVIGLLYSTSFAAKPLFGDAAGAFEEDVRNALLHLDPEGTIQEEIVAESLLAWKR
jgi:trans-aconitate methyltransferase